MPQRRTETKVTQFRGNFAVAPTGRLFVIVLLTIHLSLVWSASILLGRLAWWFCEATGLALKGRLVTLELAQGSMTGLFF
jgi:hypothetical protein